MPNPRKNPPRDLLTTLRSTLHKLEADSDPMTPRKLDLIRILKERIAAIEVNLRSAKLKLQ